MTGLFKTFSFFLSFVLILINGRILAQPMKMISASVQQFQTPVLKGNETNQVIRIKIETEGNKNPIMLQEVKLGLSGNDIHNDIEKVDIFYAVESHFLENGIRFGSAENHKTQLLSLEIRN